MRFLYLSFRAGMSLVSGNPIDFASLLREQTHELAQLSSPILPLSAVPHALRLGFLPSQNQKLPVSANFCEV